MKKNSTGSKSLSKKTGRAALENRSVTVPIVGTVGGDGIQLFKEKRNPLTETDEECARSEAKLVADFLEAGIPDFLMQGILPLIDRAFEYFGLTKPEDEHGVLDYTEENLYPLFLKSKLTNLDEIWPDEPESVTTVTPANARARLAAAILEILHNEEATDDLQDQVYDFVCSALDGSMRKFWSLPCSQPSMEHLLGFVAWKEANNAAD